MTTRLRNWSLYLVRRSDGALYCGIAQDVDARLLAHAAGRGSKALRGRGPLALVFSRRIGTRAEAQRLEAAVKRCAKVVKERIASSRTFARKWFAANSCQRVAESNRASRTTGVLASSESETATPCR